jgi:predicted dithiol-disulfide oxidoreductase (DUF899 family)
VSSPVPRDVESGDPLLRLDERLPMVRIEKEYVFDARRDRPR